MNQLYAKADSLVIIFPSALNSEWTREEKTKPNKTVLKTNLYKT